MQTNWKLGEKISQLICLCMCKYTFIVNFIDFNFLDKTNSYKKLNNYYE